MNDRGLKNNAISSVQLGRFGTCVTASSLDAAVTDREYGAAGGKLKWDTGEENGARFGGTEIIVKILIRARRVLD